MTVLALRREWARSAAPPPAQTVSEWADAYRVLPETSAARGARWRTETTPYLRGIMDAIHEPGIRSVSVMKAHQIGVSEALNNVLGYVMQHDPAPILFVQPTEGVAEAYSKDRLADMIRSTPALREIVSDKRMPAADGRAESTLTLKMFPGGYLALGGANSPNTFARWSVRVAIGDDVDRFPPVVGDEGDPGDLLKNRTTTFHDSLTIFVSTPTLVGGRIDTLYGRSDRRRYFLTCPVCGRVDVTTWNDPNHFRVAFDSGEPETAALACPDADHGTAVEVGEDGVWRFGPDVIGGCGARFDEVDRQAMIAVGAWHPTAVARDLGAVGFHVPSMLSPWTSTADLVTRFLAAREKGRESLRVFINTELAEPWEDRGARVEPHPLWARREDYGEGIDVPVGAAVLTAGVDVQDDRIEVTVYAWGLAAERWVADHVVVPGDPKRAETRAALGDALDRKYRHALGVDVAILAACVDTGYATDEMYDFVLSRGGRRTFATKGYAGARGEPLVSRPTAKGYGAKKRPVPLYRVNADAAKRDLFASLAMPVPGPNSVHFPVRVEAVDEEFFAQLCAEHRETRYNKGNVATHDVWIQDRDRNEGLDCAVLALAAFRILNPNVRAVAARIAEAAATAGVPKASTRVTPAGSGQAQGRARFVRSTYLGR